jgi:LemA protein
LAALAGVSGFYLVRLRNEIVVSQATIKSSWAQVETMLQRRYDLLPNLAETVKGYAAHEKEVFEEVARARSQWATAQTPGQRQALAPQMEGALSRLLAVSEQYPNLKASEQFLALQYQLEGTENRIAVARTRYNDALREYNSQVQQFPANLLGFDLNEQFFEAVKEAGTAPKVSFQ